MKGLPIPSLPIMAPNPYKCITGVRKEYITHWLSSKVNSTCPACISKRESPCHLEWPTKGVMERGERWQDHEGAKKSQRKIRDMKMYMLHTVEIGYEFLSAHDTSRRRRGPKEASTMPLAHELIIKWSWLLNIDVSVNSRGS